MVAINTEVGISKPVSGKPVPKVAYVLYEVYGGIGAVTRHTVSGGRLGVGQAVSLEHLGNALKQSDDQETLALIPANMVAYGASLMAWTTKARKAPMWFNVGGRHLGFRVIWPPMLWLVDRKRRSLRVFAMGSARRPHEKTRLYHAPLMNIGANGVLCEGTARLPEKLSLGEIEDVERCVFESCFTHTNHHGTLKGGADDRAHLAYWRNKERSKAAVRVAELNYWGRVEDAFRT